MLRVFPMMQNDLLPELATTLENADGTPINLTGMTVRFVMIPWDWEPGDTAKVDAAAVLVDAVNGRVKYSWVDGDTDTIGAGPWEQFRGVFQVTSGSLRFTVPNEEYIFIPIIADPSA